MEVDSAFWCNIVEIPSEFPASEDPTNTHWKNHGKNIPSGKLTWQWNMDQFSDVFPIENGDKCPLPC